MSFNKEEWEFFNMECDQSCKLNTLKNSKMALTITLSNKIHQLKRKLTVSHKLYFAINSNSQLKYVQQI
ncbi:hypothetical protein BLOT_010691 [Blomia tropicalis]|nr:hypothetical protein BLOT_010691 [Blomia tropicalis]